MSFISASYGAVCLDSSPRRYRTPQALDELGDENSLTGAELTVVSSGDVEPVLFLRACLPSYVSNKRSNDMGFPTCDIHFILAGCLEA